MNVYKVTIAECIGYRQYVGFVEADSKEEAIRKGKTQFIKERPMYSAKFRVIMCSQVRN